MKRQFNKRWHSPTNTFMHIQKFEQEQGVGALIKPENKVVRESRIAAIAAFVLSKIRGLPTYLRMPLQDPPDAYLMQPNGVSMDITTIELTSYRKSKESLLEQLIRTRKLSGAYSSEYLMLVHLFTTDGVDYEEIKKYANEKLIDYPIWAVRNVRNHPDTIAELVVVNPTTSVFEINVGKEAFEYDKKYDLPDIVFSKEVISPREVRTEETGESNIAPWQERQD